MAESEDRWQVPAAELAEPQQGVTVEERSEGSRALQGALVVLMVMVPAAFVGGWRLGRTLYRLRGY
jgi:hypothetical protein